MRNQLEKVFKLLCIVFGGLLLYQAAKVMRPREALPDFNLAGGTPSSHQSGAGKTNAPAAGAPHQAAAVPAEVQARLDRIYQSELLGPVMRPLPMALLGIGGKDAIIRAPNGQTGIIREGEEIGGIKLLRIGTNRVLIEEKGEKKELTIFSGFGSKTLVEKEK